MTSLETIISVGVAAYMASLPDYAREPVADVEPMPNVSGVAEERQIELCLNCPLADCVGIDHRRCPIRQEQLKVWREKKRH